MADTLTGISSGDIVSPLIKITEELSGGHGGLKGRFSLVDANKDQAELIIYRNSSVDPNDIEPGQWYRLEDAKINIKDSVLEVRAINDTQIEDAKQPQNPDGDWIPDRLHVIYSLRDVSDYTETVFTQQSIATRGSSKIIKQGDGVLLYDIGDNEVDKEVVYGPLRAAGTETSSTDSVWGQNISAEAPLEWEQLFRINPEELRIPPETDILTEDDATQYVKRLRENGLKITIAEDGEIVIENSEEVEEDEEKTGDDDIEEREGGQRPATDDPTTGRTDIKTLRELSRPMDMGTAIEEAEQPGVAVLQMAVDGQLRPYLYRKAVSHLIAGKNVVFYGPPGSGKTHLAKRLSYGVCASVNLSTANAEWTYQQVVGGYRPTGDSFEPSPGILTEAAATCQRTLANQSHPSWLIIDELNRANLDEAFGEIFTLLDIDHRPETPISYAEGENQDTKQEVPMGFRILGTMNTQDQAQLFALGYAFRRRFAFLRVPPLHTDIDNEHDYEPVVDELSLDIQSERALQIILRAVRSSFKQPSSDAEQEELTEQVGDVDSRYSLPQLEEAVFTGTEVVNEALSNVSPPTGSLAPERALISFVEELSNQEVVDIGQGILIDALKYVVVTERLFPEEAGWSALDEAIVAYILPQVEPYMSELRRAETVRDTGDAVSRFQQVRTHAENLGFSETAHHLERAEKTHQIIE